MPSLSDTGLKNRLEHGVWIDEVERSFRAWREAPNAEKPALLLAGMVLTWAESWRLTHAEDFTPQVHTYIARSLAAQSNKTSAEREANDVETRRRDRVYQQILLLMAVFAIVVLGPSAMRLYSAHLDRLTGTESASETPPPLVDRRTIAVIQTQEPMEEAPAPAALQWPTQRLIAQARTDATAGRRREATLYALETLDAVDRAPADAAPTDQAKAMSVIANLHRQTIAMPSGADVEENAPVHVCTPHRYVTQSSRGHIVIMDEKIGKIIHPGSTKLTDGMLDPTCDQLLVIGEDYDIKVQPIDPAQRGKILGTHDTAIVAARFSGNGHRIVSVSRDAVGKVWDAATGKRVSSFRSEAQMFNGAALSHDGATVITWSDNHSAELWDSATGKRLGALVGHQSQISTARFSLDGQTILTVSVDGTAIAWTSATRTVRSTLRPKDSSIVDAELTADGRQAIARLEEDRIVIWPVGADTVAKTIDLGDDKLQAFVVSPDGRHLAILETSGAISIYAVNSGDRLIDLNPAGDPVIGLSFSKTGNAVTAFSRNNASRWSLPMTREAVLGLSQASTMCWSATERSALKLEPRLPAWCPATTAEGDVSSKH